MRILFMGTPDFAVCSLEALIKTKHEVVGVFTQTDKPVGRKQLMTFSDVKKCAIDNGLTVYQPKTLRNDEAIDIIKSINPDLIVVVAYGKILPKDILEYPKYGCINIHGSLLPKYRGAAPIQWSVINGEKQTGVTSMYMDEGLDTGDIIIKNTVEIGDNETSEQLYERLKVVGAKTLVDTVSLIEEGKAPREKQKDEEMTLAPILTKSLSNIDFNKDAIQVHNLIRGLNSWPVASTMIDNKRMKIWDSRVSEYKGGKAGEVISLEPFIVSCNNNTTIEIKEVQLEGKKRMSAKDFLRGAHIKVGTILG